MGRGPPHKTFQGDHGELKREHLQPSIAMKNVSSEKLCMIFFSSEFQILGVQSSSLYIWLIIQKLKAKPEHYRVR